MNAPHLGLMMVMFKIANVYLGRMPVMELIKGNVKLEVGGACKFGQDGLRFKTAPTA